jgi:hypothetical protein
MYAQISDLTINPNVKGELCLSFSATSTIDSSNPTDLMRKIFSDILRRDDTTPSSVMDVEGKMWQVIDEDLACRLDQDSNKIVFRDTSSQSKSSGLILVPSILIDAQIISEEQKNIISAVISENTHVKKKGNNNAQSNEDYSFLTSSARRCFDKK